MIQPCLHTACAVLLSTTLAAQTEHFQGRPTIEEGITICFDADTDPELIARYYRENPNLKYNLGGRWSGAQGSPRVLTWSLVPDGLDLPGSIGEPASPSALFTVLDTKFGGNRSLWLQRLQECFDRWEELSGVTFVRLNVFGEEWDDGAIWGASGSLTRGDIRIGMHAVDGGGGVLGYAGFPSSGDMVLDRAENWASNLNANRFLRNTVMHELGHTLGLGHVCSIDQRYLMNPGLDTGIDGPRHDEIRAAQRHYGDLFEPDDSAAQATDLGVLFGPALELGVPLPAPPAGSTPGFSSLLSIDANGESDWFRLRVASPSRFQATVTPRGLAYDDSDQNGDGSCATGTTTDSSSSQNLALQLRAADGTTILATASSAAAGKAESLDLPMLAPGTYHVRVYETGNANQTQLYSLRLAATGRPVLESLLPAATVTLLLP